MSGKSHTGTSGRPGAIPQAESPVRLRHAALVLGIALLCYVQTAGYGFVWDDNQQIGANDRIRSFSRLKEAFAEPFWAFHEPKLRGHYYRPLQTLAYMVGYAVAGLDPAPYHWLNIVLHALAALAVVWLGWEATRSQRVALWAGMLFAAHPMHTESVAWCAGITDIGCGLFYFVALACLMRSARRGTLWGWLAGAAFLAALLFKETALTLPVVAVAGYWMLYDRKPGAHRSLNSARWLPLALALGAYLSLRIHALGSFAAKANEISLALWDRLLTLAYLAGLYLAKLLLPFGHNAYRVFEPFSRIESARSIPPVVFLLLCGALVVRLRRERRLAFSALFVLISLAPALSLESVGRNVFAERYLYIPSAGFCLFAAFLVEGMESRLVSLRLRRVLAGAAVAAYVVLVWIRNPVWRDEMTFYTATLETSPAAAMMHQNLGVLYYREGQPAAALVEFEAARASAERAFIRSVRDKRDALLGIATSCLALGRLEDAWRAAAAARELDPECQQAWFILGGVRSRQGRDADAEPLLAKAVELAPSDAAARINLGSVLLFRGKRAEAEEQFRAALALEPGSAPARLGLAMCLAASGDQDQALRIVREILREQPGNADARRLLEQIHGSAAKAPRLP